VTEQKCEQCEQVLPLGSFTQMTPTKYRSVCKACNLGAAQVQRWAKVGAAARHQQGKMMRATIAR
jgi:hypothetical protein